MDTQAPGEYGEYIAARRIGDATVTLINDGVFGAIPLVPWMQVPADEVRREMPEADAVGGCGLIAAFVHIGDAAILIDPGAGEVAADARLVTAFRLRPTPGVRAGLAAIGVAPTQITQVLLTHAHGDHITGTTVVRDGQRVPRYPRARYLLGRADWEGNPARDAPTSEVAPHLAALDRLGLLDLVDGDAEVAPGVTMIAAPGESPGHAIVRVVSAGARFSYLGDLFHHPCEVAHPDWVLVGRDKAAMIASRQRLIADAVRTDAILACTHNVFPGWGRIARVDAGYRWDDA